MYINSAALGKHLDDELATYRRIARGPKNHPGRQAIRSVLDHFHVDGTDEQHRCLVHPPLGDNLSDFLRRNPVRRLPRPILVFVLHHLFLALDYLHKECHIIHTGTCCRYHAIFSRLLRNCDRLADLCMDLQISRQTTSCFPSPAIWFSRSSSKTNFATPPRGRSWMEERSTYPPSSVDPKIGVHLCCATLALLCSAVSSIPKIFSLTSIERRKLS